VHAGRRQTAGSRWRSRTRALATRVFHQQIVPVEIDAAGNLVALASTNALTLTIGAF
jgi:hypothetical protein